MKQNFIIEQWDLLLVILGAFISVILLLLGIIPDFYISSLILSILGIVAINQLRSNISRKEEIKRIHNLNQPLTLNKTIYKRDFYNLLTTQVLNATEIVCLTNLDYGPYRLVGIPERVRYYEVINELIIRNSKVGFNRIYGIPKNLAERTRKLIWIGKQLEEYKNCKNFNARIIDFQKYGGYVYPLSLQIIDNSQAFIVNIQTGGHSTGDLDANLWSKDPEVVRHLVDYYHVLWNSCQPLKEDQFVNWDLFESLGGKPPVKL